MTGIGTPSPDPGPLDRLLGRAGAAIGCEVCFADLDRYVELETAGVDAKRIMPELHSHFEVCRACHEDHESLLALSRRLPQSL
jgi:hypothetical protein